jgi:hypothetical protein
MGADNPAGQPANLSVKTIFRGLFLAFQRQINSRNNDYH